MFVEAVVVAERIKMPEKMFQKMPPDQDAAVNQTRGDIDGEWRVVGPKNGQGVCEIITVAIVEGEGDEFAAGRLADCRGDLIKWNDFVTLPPNVVKQSIQPFGNNLKIAVGGEKGNLRGGDDTVKAEDRANSRIHGAGKELEARVDKFLHRKESNGTRTLDKPSMADGSIPSVCAVMPKIAPDPAARFEAAATRKAPRFSNAAPARNESETKASRANFVRKAAQPGWPAPFPRPGSGAA